MSYLVKEIFYTLQGEGGNVGRPAVFVRFACCNLWTGREKDRHKAVCKFCDTDFVGGERLGDRGILDRALELWPKGGRRLDRMVVLTGGEPLLQVDLELVHTLRVNSFFVAVETNGTVPLPERGVDWVCVSPKTPVDQLKIREGDELKLVFPQEGIDPRDYERLVFVEFRLQPMDGPELERNTQMAVEYCLAHPRWGLSLQTHKILGLR
jgi:7-carboxy-7-deazaguanine synthase